ncbi:unnamed protein product, partial [Pelagomonas calceolata]
RDYRTGGEATEGDVSESRGGFDLHNSNFLAKIAELFCRGSQQFCACAQKKRCRGPLGCSHAHTHRAWTPRPNAISDSSPTCGYLAPGGYLATA